MPMPAFRTCVRVAVCRAWWTLPSLYSSPVPPLLFGRSSQAQHGAGSGTCERVFVHMLLQLPLLPVDARRLLKWLVKTDLLAASQVGAVQCSEGQAADGGLLVASQLLSVAARSGPLESQTSRALLDVASRYCVGV